MHLLGITKRRAYVRKFYDKYSYSKRGNWDIWTSSLWSNWGGDLKIMKDLIVKRTASSILLVMALIEYTIYKSRDLHFLRKKGLIKKTKVCATIIYKKKHFFYRRSHKSLIQKIGKHLNEQSTQEVHLSPLWFPRNYCVYLINSFELEFINSWYRG